jgi:hypothetical protein
LLDALLCYDGVTKREKRMRRNYFDPHMVVVEITIINVLSLKRDLHIYEVLSRFISNGKDLQTNV